jgi:hypothetical protein
MLLPGNRLFGLSILAILPAVSVAAQGISIPVPVPTPTSYSWSYSFPPVGFAFPETLQVNLVNQPLALLEVISPNGCSLCSTFQIPTTSASAIATSCTGTITFTNSAGTKIGASVPFTVATGQIFSAPLPFSMTGYSGFRGEILASVQGTSTLPSTNLCSLTISLETFDTNTGVTHVFLTAPAQTTAYLTGNFSAIPPVPGPMLNSK